MEAHRHSLLMIAVFAIVGLLPTLCTARSDVPLPKGVKAVWDLHKTYRETTPMRERICINGLWRWQPAKNMVDKVPAGGWGYFKVPGPWPGTSHWMQRASQTHYSQPIWENQDLHKVDMAWYQREITVPKYWAGRRIAVYTEYLNSYAAVYIDGNKMGEIKFPEGEVDITSFCRLGSKHLLSLFVVAMPLNEEIVSYAAADGATRHKASVARRGLCGDVFLVSTPSEAHINDVKVDTSVRKRKITLDIELLGLGVDKKYNLSALITDNGRKVNKIKSRRFTIADLKQDRFAFTGTWKPSKLWDVHTPQNMYGVQLSLIDSNDNVLDIFQTVLFGFREFWIDGRDFRLNGTRFFGFALQLDNAQISSASASYAEAYKTMRRLKTVGVNMVYTHNYGCQPGVHIGFEEILKAADDVGMLVSLSLPHASSYNWKTLNADDTNGYADHTEFYVRMAQNHPSVVMYSMNHNMTGYPHDMNPDFIDGFHNNKGKRGPRMDYNARLANRTENIVRRFDQTRVIYHHSSGNLGQMHTSNFYLNFVPIQERSDWFEHWASEGIKPLFLCEYGLPLGMSWTLHRGWDKGKWYKGKKHYTLGKLQYQFCTGEWGSQFLGDASYKLTDEEEANIRFEAKQWRAGNTWYQWSYPFKIHDAPLGIPNISDVQAMYITDNWRAYRTWGVSLLNIHAYGNLWKLKEGVSTNRKTFKVDWDNLQKPGFSPDFVKRQYNRSEITKPAPWMRMDTAYQVSDWIVTNAGKALVRNNQPLLAYIAGKPARFTSKDHNFYAGETVEKQIIIINNSREKVTCKCSWSLGLPVAQNDSKKVRVETGEQERITLRFVLPSTLPAGEYRLTMIAKFNTGNMQKDTFIINVMPAAQSLKPMVSIALFDPQGETRQLLNEIGVRYEPVAANADFFPYDILIVGKGALTVDGPAPDIGRVSDGLKVLIFEQSSDVLERRLGFRVQEYGLRRIFKRIPDHPVLAGLGTDNLCNWRGQATIVPPRLEYEFNPRHYPTIKWCGMKVTRPWRCGNYGNVATVLIEKPTRGNFMPIVDGGFNLQYSPLMEYHESKGMVIFCQMDVTGRTQRDPAAVQLVENLLKYITSWSPRPRRKLLYVGDPVGKQYFENAGMAPGTYAGAELNADHLLVVGPGGGRQLAAYKHDITSWLKNGGHLLAIALNEREAASFLPFDVRMKKAEHISAYFTPACMKSPLAGIGPADVTIRDSRELSLISAGVDKVGNGVLGVADNANVVFCQLAPWQFDYKRLYNLKITFRRTGFLVARLSANMGAGGTTPLIARFFSPVADNWFKRSEKRWLSGFYLETPVEMDDPYRFFRW